MRGAPTVLMMGEGMRKASHLEDFLKRGGWVCRVETDLPAALRLSEQSPYDLFLSGVRMDRIQRTSLVGSATEAKASLFFSMAVEYGCWWLPAVRLGENCADSPALPPKRFAEEVERLRLALMLLPEPAPIVAPLAAAAAVGGRARDLKRPTPSDQRIAAAFRLSA